MQSVQTILLPILVLVGVLAPAVGFAGDSELILYQDCKGAGSGEVKLYAIPTAESARQSVITFGDMSFVGSSNEDLTEFRSNDGFVTASFKVNKYGESQSAELVLIQAGKKLTFEQCIPTDLGGGSISVHND